MNVLKEDFLSIYYKFSLVFDKPEWVILKTAGNNANITEKDLVLTGFLTHTQKHTQRRVLHSFSRYSKRRVNPKLFLRFGILSIMRMS